MKPPTDVTEIQRLAGMVNYHAKFLPGLSDAMKPIRCLTNKHVESNWGKEQEDAFKKMKKLVAYATVLSYYDLSRSHLCTTDGGEVFETCPSDKSESSRYDKPQKKMK